MLEWRWTGPRAVQMAADPSHAAAVAEMLLLRSEGTGRNPPPGSPGRAGVEFELREDEGQELGGGPASSRGETGAQGGAGLVWGAAGVVQVGDGKKVKRKKRPKELTEVSAELAGRQAPAGEGEQAPAPEEENADPRLASEEEDWTPPMIPTPHRKSPKEFAAPSRRSSGISALDSGQVSRVSSSAHVARMPSEVESLFGSRPSLPELPDAVERNVATQTICTGSGVFKVPQGLT